MSGSSEIAWYISREGERFGPFSAEEFGRFEREGQLLPTDCLWHTGLNDWIAYGDYRAARETALQLTTSSNADARRGTTRRAFFHLLRRALHIPAEILTTAISVIKGPTHFGKSRIDTGPRDLARAVYFYGNIFLLAFLVESSLSHLNFLTGLSQPRELAWLAIQIALGVPILYLLNVVTRQRVRFSGVAQGVLYADALFLVPLTLVGLVLSYLAFSQSTSQRELDILVTEFEQCLAQESFLYWLVRGDLQFFMYLPTTRYAEYREFATDYFQYALAIPFCFLFGKLMQGRYGASVLLNAVLAIIVFTLVVVSVSYGREKFRTAFAHTSTCVDVIAARGSQKYNPLLLKKQIGTRINRHLNRALKTDRTWISLVEDGYLMELQIRASTGDTTAALAEMAAEARWLYCGNNTDFRFARALRIPVLLVVRDDVGRVVRREEINPGSCSRQ